MEAITILPEAYIKYHAYKMDVMLECGSRKAAIALMKKWGESSLDDAIYREAKHRMVTG